jgi:hypothetical protein
VQRPQQARDAPAGRPVRVARALHHLAHEHARIRDQYDRSTARQTRVHGRRIKQPLTFPSRLTARGRSARAEGPGLGEKRIPGRAVSRWAPDRSPQPPYSAPGWGRRLTVSNRPRPVSRR